ncbi:unnamed protein product [Arctogadus glacialis]
MCGLRTQRQTWRRGTVSQRASSQRTFTQRSKAPSLGFLSHINVDRSSRPQKTPGRGGSDNAHHGEDEDTFYSLASARSHPDLSNSPAAGPVSMGQPGLSPWGSRACLHGAAGPVSMGQPGLSPWGSRACLHGAAGPVSMGLSGSTAAGGDRLMHHRADTHTSCVGAENEPENGPDDWMRMAELQSRNKACLPHLKSS